MENNNVRGGFDSVIDIRLDIIEPEVLKNLLLKFQWFQKTKTQSTISITGISYWLLL